ncbi:hypothetical protein TBC1_11488 [Lentimicrobium saccharophilum]|uniref:Asparagine synthase n=1 Tax=Lentimicrobium saccharophilum TaxID=1678841 RepID=A0A0S7BV89_9BACT|nr:hypothetical protein [Lentimicrobium saccharophilum]GAP42359.1 hypothetical protein TBC1_11488 [Lentimicrobium saccharophilum]
MGAFFINHINSKVSVAALDKIYKEKGFLDPFVVSMGDYQLRLYKKKLLDVQNFIQRESISLYACGSIVYNKYNYEKSLKALLSDYSAGKIDPSALSGNYVLIFHDRKINKIEFFVDPAFIKNVYFDKVNRVISSDFLAIIDAVDNTFTLNRTAVIENITTGHLISPDTYVNEIQKLDKVNVKELAVDFTGIIFNVIKPDIVSNLTSRNDAIDHAILTLNSYFLNVASLSNEFGAHIGLTGGFDSRLLLMLGKKHISRLVTNSFWRPDSKEYLHAKELAMVSGKKFFSYEEKPFLKPEWNKMLDTSFYFYDGQIRSQNRWDEIFSLPEYTSGIAQEHYVGFHGCGGEQYRNADRFLRPKSLRSYIQYQWMFKQCKDPFLESKLKWEIYSNIEIKINRLMGFNISKIDLLLLKRIQNEIWNPANRTTRLNLLNQQQFYFAPFAEYEVSHSAYYYTPFLGNSLSFQIDMMRRLDNELAKVQTNYGFNLIEGEPIKFYFIPFIVNLLPDQWFHSIYFRLKKAQILSGNESQKKLNENSFFRELSNKIDLTSILNNINLGSGLISMNHLLKQLNGKVNL